MNESKNQACAVEEDGDEICTPIPNSCQRFACKEHHPKLENVNGFMVCPRCKASYGKAAGAGGRKPATPESNGVKALVSASGSVACPKSQQDINQERRVIVATTLWWFQNLPQSDITKEQIEEQAFFAYHNEPIFHEIVKEIVWRLEQLDAENQKPPNA